MSLNARIDPSIIDAADAVISDYSRLREAGLINLEGTFFPSVHYPPITMYPQISQEDLFKSYSNPENGLFDVYVHIPFCLKLCTFCHYPVKTGAAAAEKDGYLDALEKEMDIYMRVLGLEKIKMRSVLVGGGTPTYLTPGQLERFLRYFTGKADLSKCTQFSYDVDPPTLLGDDGKERLRLMREYGVDRLTIGIQALDDGILKAMNRPHDVDQALRSIEESRKAGFKVNIEFIYGYPYQTLEDWVATLEKAVSLDAEEIQLYQLKVIPYGDLNGTILSDFRKSKADFLTKETTLRMKSCAISLLAQSGYNENLTRVFTKTARDFSHYAHNQCCMLYDEIGFGQTAFSSLRDRFGLNTLDLDKYYSCIGRGRLPLDRGLVRDKEEQIRWSIILPLKNRRVIRKYFDKVSGVPLESVFRRKIGVLKEFGLVSEDSNFLSLTPLGRFFADEVCHQFHSPEYMPFPRDAYSAGPLNPHNHTDPYS
ncbi:MAG: coproporphyrinogen III oxidase family protein [Elusimicrobia bacterium]|nr:coproporphyrinogen III oxidase family protein [Elusimicrobiota bacterium]